MSLNELPAEVVTKSEPANAPSYESRDPDAPVVVTGSKGARFKLKLCPLSDGSLRVTLPCGTTRTIVSRGGEFHPSGCFSFGREETYKELGNAIDRVTRFSKLEFAPLARSAEEVLALAKEAEGSREACCKILRMLLRERTGRDWSVKGARGTAYSWVSIRATPRRCDRFGKMEAEDRLVLHAALGEWATGDISIRPCGGVRGYYVFRAAGVPVPATWRINAPSWD